MMNIDRQTMPVGTWMHFFEDPAALYSNRHFALTGEDLFLDHLIDELLVLGYQIVKVQYLYEIVPVHRYMT